MQVDATIFGGLPVLVELASQSADRDAGYDSQVEIDAIYTCRLRKRDRRWVKRPIPRSWWQKLEKTGELGELERRLAAEC